MLRPHLILVPGLMCDATVWEHQTRELRALTSRITIPDHGSLNSLSSMAEAILERAPDKFALTVIRWAAVIEHCGHMSIMESPTEVTAAMRDWLTSL